MRIVIPDDYQNAVRTLDCFARLEGHEVVVFHDGTTDVGELARRFADAEALVLIRERTAIGRELLERLPKLRLISQTGRGTAHIDLPACRERGVTVCAGSGSPWAPAELTWALILASMRRVPEEAGALARGSWQTTLGTTVRGRVLGIWGYGRIGRIVAGYGRAFGMRVLAWGRSGSLERAAEDGVETAADASDLLERSDVLSLHLKLEPDTRSIVTRDDLARMKRTALFVNTSRAELVEPGALAAALRDGRPGFAAVDVYEEEPARKGAEQLLDLPNCLCTPHIGYVEKDSYELYFGEAFDHVLACAAGRPTGVVGGGVD